MTEIPTFDELFGSMKQDQEKRIQAGVTVDVAVRLAVVCACKILKPREMYEVFSVMNEDLMDQFEGPEEKQIARSEFNKITESLLESCRECHSEE